MTEEGTVQSDDEGFVVITPTSSSTPSVSGETTVQSDDGFDVVSISASG